MKTISNAVRIACLAFCAFALGACGGEDNDGGDGGGGSKPGPVEFTVNRSNIVSSDFVGFGTQYNNNLYTPLSRNVDGVSDQNLPDLENKVKQLGSQHVRIFFTCKSWEGYPKHDPEFMPSFIKTVQLAQASGSTVNVTYWHGAMNDQYDENGEFPASMQMSGFASLLHHLIVDLGLSCVQYITIQNEVNTTSCTRENYVAAYRKLDAALKAKGIRDRVKFVAGDLLVDELKDDVPVTNWINHMSQTANDVIDGYSVHLYWNHGIVNDALVRMRYAYNTIQALSSEKRKPLYVTEYSPTSDWRNQAGAQYAPGFLTGTTTPLALTNEYALIHAWFQIWALNYKYVGFAKWDCYKAKYDNGTQFFSEIGIASEGYPIRPAYYMTWLFTHTCKPGWSVVETKAGVDINKAVAVMQSKSADEMTIYAANRSSGSLNFVIGGLPAKKTFRVFLWNKNFKSKVTKEADVTTDDNGVLRLPIATLSFVAITTLDVNLTNLPD